MIVKLPPFRSTVNGKPVTYGHPPIDFAASSLGPSLNRSKTFAKRRACARVVQHEQGVYVTAWRQGSPLKTYTAILRDCVIDGDHVKRFVGKVLGTYR